MVLKSFLMTLVLIVFFTACGKNPIQELEGVAAEGLPVVGSAGGNSGLSSDEAAFLVLINNLRTQNGLSLLETEPHLQIAAEAHSAYMNSNDTLTHDEPAPNLASWDRIENAGGSFSATGENIACGNQSAADTFNQWKNSPGHLANMLSTNYQFIGIARGGSDADAITHTCPWYWTTDFGGN